jgi:hypothetical protein
MPKRPGRGHNWILGERAWRQLLEQGVDAHDLQASVERYARYVELGGLSSDAFVIGIDQFFGAIDRPWLQAWELPTARAGNGKRTVAEKLAALEGQGDE